MNYGFLETFEFNPLLFTEERVQGSELPTCLQVWELWTHQLKSFALLSPCNAPGNVIPFKLTCQTALRCTRKAHSNQAEGSGRKKKKVEMKPRSATIPNDTERRRKKNSRRKLHRVNYERNPILEQKDCATCIQSNVELLATTEKAQKKHPATTRAHRGCNTWLEQR